MDLTDKNIVITGASKGLGRAIAVQLSSSMPNLILVARTRSLLEELRLELENSTGRTPLAIVCDITKEDDVNAMVQMIGGKFGHIDVLINNAGMGIHKSSELLTNEEMRRQFELNFYGVYYCIKALLPLIKNSAGGYILNIGSLVSEISFADNSVYAATKYALSGFSEGLYYEMKRYNIKTGFFLPGIMDTSFQNDRKASTVPAFLRLKAGDAAKKVEYMIRKRKKRLYMYKWMLALMRIKRFFNTLY